MDLTRTTIRLLLATLITGLVAKFCYAGQPDDWLTVAGNDLSDKPLAGTTVNQPDFAGIKRDTWYFLGYELVAIGFLYVMPESVSSWEEESKNEISLKKWWRNASKPTRDEDKAYLNYVLHPYWGAAYYVRARERGYNRYQSFWYSALLSSLYEFGAESLFEQPSIQDLLVTPIAGSLLGSYFMRVRETIKQRTAGPIGVSTIDKALLVMTDPLGGLNSKVDQWLGRDVQVTVKPYIQKHNPTRPNPYNKSPQGTIYGIEIKVNF